MQAAQSLREQLDQAQQELADARSHTEQELQRDHLLVELRAELARAHQQAHDQAHHADLRLEVGGLPAAGTL